MVDFEKAFNRQNHEILMTKLSDMGLSGWLLNIVMGFLTEREMVLSYKGARSENKSMPGGGPQGTILGMFLFIILINSAGFEGQNRSMGTVLTQPLKSRKPIPSIHLKFLDDMTIAEAVNLKQSLKHDEDRVWPKPPPFHSRSEHVLPPANSLVQTQLNDLTEYDTPSAIMTIFQSDKPKF